MQITAKSEKTQERGRILLAAALLAIALLLVYSNSFSGPFIFDDTVSITQNPTIRKLWPPWAALSPPDGTTTGGRPLVNYSLAINMAISGNNVWSYHAINLGIHVLAALLLFGVIRRTLLQPLLATRFGAASLPLACMATLLWAIHPLQTESVTYIVQRAESLCAFFYLLALYSFIRSVDSSRRLTWRTASVIACAAAMASKEVAVSAPFMIWIYDRTFVGGTFAESLRRRWKYYLWLASTWLLLAWLVVGTGNRGGTAGFGLGPSWVNYVFTQCHAVVMYLKLVFWPHPLVLDYGDTVVGSFAEVWPQAFLLTALVAGVLVALWRWPVIGLVGCWFFGLLAPTSSIVPVITQTMAEHRVYLASAGIVVFFVCGLYTTLAARWRKLYWAGMTMAVLALGFTTWQRNDAYRSITSIWDDTLSKVPGSYRALNNYGLTLLMDHRYAEAISKFEQALKLHPGLPDAENNIGVAWEKMGRPREAAAHYLAALDRDPTFMDARSNLPRILVDEGKLDEAKRFSEETVRLEPRNADAHLQLGIILGRRGKFSEALAEFETAGRLAPNLTSISYNRGLALGKMGRFREACMQYGEVIRKEPDHADALNNLAWLLATAPDPSIRDGRRAVVLAEKAVTLAKPPSAESLDTLACAYAEAGDFERAKESARQSLRLFKANGRNEDAEDIRRRAALFEKNQPFHQSAP